MAYLNNTFKNTDDVLRKEAGYTTKLDYFEQFLFAKKVPAEEKPAGSCQAQHRRQGRYSLSQLRPGNGEGRRKTYHVGVLPFG